MITIEQLWNAMPRDTQRKISCHDLKRIADSMNASTNHDANIDQDEYTAIMDRLEGRLLCYAYLADRCKGGPKLYTKAQLENAKSKAMQEARIIVWTHCDAERKSKREAAESADEKPDGQAVNSSINPHA